jgi:hypothetical protein
MRYRPPVGALLLFGMLLPLTSCVTSPSLTSITISPTSMNFGGAGLTAQLTAIGYYSHPNHPAETKDITDQVTWASSAVGCVTVSNTGMITSGENTCSNILVSASAPGFPGLITASMTVNVTQPTTGGSGPTGAGDVSTINIIPSSQSVPAVGDTAQFLAIGTTSSGATVNLSGLVSWTSSSPQVATIGAISGIATAVAQGTSTITALYTNADGTAATGTASFTVVAGATEAFTALSIIPNSQSVSASGQSANFVALATSGSTNLSEDVTNAADVTWSSTIPTIATVTSGGAAGNGLVTGVSVGTATIIAQLTNKDGSVLTATATVGVTATAAPEPLLSLNIIPSSITVGNLQDTGNFLAVGTFSQSPYVRDLTNSVNWLSSSPETFPVITASDTTANPGAPAGTVTAFGFGSATIIAQATDPTTGSIQTATALFTCPPPTEPIQPGECYEGSQATALLATITVYNEGNNTTDWQITASSATGTADVLHCGPGWTGAGGSVCVATYPIDTKTPSGNPGVVLTAQGGAFGGWSYNCTPSDVNGNAVAAPGFDAAGPNYCVVDLTETVFDQLTGTDVTINGVDQSVGAIFN